MNEQIVTTSKKEYKVIYDDVLGAWTQVKADKGSYTLQEAVKEAEKRNNGTTVQCKDCKRFFALTQETMDWYKSQGFELPKRCFACRTERRNKQNKEQ